MLDIPTLERRWLKYKIKSYLPHLLITLTIIGFVVALSVLFISSKSDLQTVKASKPAVVQKNPPKNFQENAIILEPSMQFIQSISPDTKQPKEPNIIKIPVIDTPIKSSQDKTVVKPKAPPVLTPLVSIAPAVPMVSKPPITSVKAPTIKRDSDTFDIHEIEERFKNNSNPHLGLYIARYHYEHGNYSEAYNYALKTNSISSTMEESWLIFAKSLVKLGKSDQAKKTLQLYISQSNSENAKSLLNSIEQGGVK